MPDTMSSTYATGDRGHHTTAASVSMIALTTVAVGSRIVARKVSKRIGLWWDDWLALAAWAFCIVELSFSIDIVAHGFGRHVRDVSEHNINAIFLDAFIAQIFYNIGLTLIKISALFFYVRIFSLQQRWFTIAVYTVGTLVIAWCIVITSVGSLQCEPRRKLWRPSVSGTCMDQRSVWLGTATPNVIIDFMILMLPMPFVVGLQISKKRRAGLVLVFALGYCSMALSMARTIEVALLNSEQMKDPTWYENVDVLLVSLELGIGLVSICLPAHITLVRYIAKHIFQSNSDSVSTRGRGGIYTGSLAEPWAKRHRRSVRDRPSAGDLETLARSSGQTARTQISASSTIVDRERHLECGSELWDMF